MNEEYDWSRFKPATEETEIPKELYRRTAGHGYDAGCECDLEGGDPDCQIQPPYETIGGYIDRLLGIIIELTPEKYHPWPCSSCGRDMNKGYIGNCNDCIPF
jgi:hypothetical protein